MGVAKTPTKKGTTVTKNYQKTMPKTSTAPEVAVPDAVTISMKEIAEDMREGLLALAVGAGLQVMSSLMEADVAAACGPRGRHDPERTAVRHGSERGSVTWAGVEWASNGRGCVPPVAVRCPCLPMTCSAAARSWAGWR